MCDFSHPHTSPKCDHTHRTHRGHYLVHHTKIQKIAAASTAAGGGSTGCSLAVKSATSNTKNGVELSWAASHKRGVEGAHVGADMP